MALKEPLVSKLGFRVRAHAVSSCVDNLQSFEKDVIDLTSSKVTFNFYPFFKIIKEVNSYKPLFGKGENEDFLPSSKTPLMNTVHDIIYVCITGLIQINGE